LENESSASIDWSLVKVLQNAKSKRASAEFPRASFVNVIMIQYTILAFAVKNENGGRNQRHFVGVTLTAFSLGGHGGGAEKPDCRDKDCSIHDVPSVLGY
jgi:hypothetical protein